MSLSFRFLGIGIIFILLTGVFIACEDDNPGGADTDNIAEVRANLISNVANQIILPAYQDLASKVSALEGALDDFSQTPDAATLAEAQNALKAAWVSWQSASIYLFGPAETQGLRQALATYPTDAQKIEANIASGSYVLGTLDNRAAVGFPALDYLLNANEAATTLAAFSSSDANSAARIQYLTDLVGEIRDRVQATLSGWNANEGNYLATFTAEDALGTDVGSSLGLLVNAMDLHYQRFVRDGKIAIPAGVRSAGVPRPTTIEAKYGQYSVELLIASLNAYEKLFLGMDFSGRDGVGLYDYLFALDANDLAVDMQTQYSANITAAQNTLSDPLDALIESNNQALTDMFLELQKIVVLFKSDMASVMGISITNQDNDGD